IFDRLKSFAHTLKRDAYAVYLAAADPELHWYVKALAAAVAPYAFSPIDLIPDFIPVIGYLDDLLLVPLGIWLVVSLIPKEAMAKYRAEASARMQRPTGGKIAAIVIAGMWLFGAVLLCWLALSRWSG